MALALINAVCPHCFTQFSETPKSSFLGFQKLVCPNCKEDVVYPLTRGYRITYWVLFVYMLLSVVVALSNGEIGFPGGMGIAVMIALVRDKILKSRVAKAAEGAGAARG